MHSATKRAAPNNTASKQVIKPNIINTMEHLQIKIGEDKQASFNYSRGFLLLARAIGKLALHEDEFAICLNMVMIGVNEEIKANHLRDEMIEMTKPEKR